MVEVLANGLDPLKTTLASIIHPPAVIANESEDTSHASERKRAHGIRRIPIVDDDGRLVGIATLNDLLGGVVGDTQALLDVMVKGTKREQHLRR